MKKVLAFILISAFLSPVFSYAATASITAPKPTDTTLTQTTTVSPLTVETTDINTQLHTLLSTLTDLTKRTQNAADQLNLNGIDLITLNSSR